MRFKNVITSVSGCVLALCAVMVPQARGSVFIHEILADPPSVGGDANRDGVVSSSDDEFIEIYNASKDAVDISGWALFDDIRQRHVFEQGTWIDPFGLRVVFGGGGGLGLSGGIYSSASSGGLGLNNNGDTIRLLDSWGALIDQVVYGPDGGKDQSLVRFTADSQLVLYSSVFESDKFGPGVFREGGSDNSPVNVVPEPVTAVSLMMGISGLVFFKKRRSLENS